MIQNLIDKREREEGFTLIELMVVVLIIAILIAIAIPTFLGARERAQNRAAQSSARNALTAAKTIFTDEEDYTQATATALQAVEPSLSFNATASTEQNMVAVNEAANTANLWQAVVRSNSGTCFYIRDNTAGPGTEFGDAADSGGSCAVAPTGVTFGSSW